MFKMSEDSEINILVSNIVNETRFSNCRLCLKRISDKYVRFNDFVTLDGSNAEFRPLSEYLKKALCDDQICEEIAGIDAVCLTCVDKTLDMIKFVDMCKNSNELLRNVFENLESTLNVDFDITKNKALYIVINEHETNALLIRDDIQEKENVNTTDLKLNTREKKKRKQFECYNCDEILYSLDDYKAHNLGYHSMLTCDLCQETCNNEEELATHSNVAHRYQCVQCSTRTSSEEDLKDHIYKHHNTYVCKECGISCQGLEKLRAHELKHVSKHECPKCGKAYSTKEFYMKHVKLCLEDKLDPHPIRNEIVKTYFCDKCGKGYSTPGGLRVHNRFAHGGAKPHECKHCGKQFTAPSYLKTHMIKHTGEKNFKCDICSNRFVSKEALLYHTRRHTGEKPYSCKHCSERFVNASARAEHIKFKHVGPTLMCEICSHKFVTPHFLKQHMSRHHDPMSKLYISRTLAPNMPGDDNKKIKYDIMS